MTSPLTPSAACIAAMNSANRPGRLPATAPPGLPHGPVQWQTVCEVQLQSDCGVSLSTTSAERLYCTAHRTALATAPPDCQLRFSSARFETSPSGET